MNLKPPTPRGGLHRTLRVLSLLLLQHALAPNGTDANARSRLPEDPEREPGTDANSRPYLKVAGSLPLRFSAAPRPLAILPAKAVPAATPPVQPTAATPPEVIPGAVPPIANLDSKNPPDDSTVASSIPAGSKPALSILPDNTRASTRAEDFLPFFQFPSSNGTNVATPPTPGQLPPSSATYQQR